MANMDYSNKFNNIIKKNIGYAFIAQIISLLVSLLMSLLVPKLLGVEEFSYWQLFLFYSGYSGFLHFGLNDGIYLNEGGKEIEEINKNLIGSQIKFSILFQIIISMIMMMLSFILVDNVDRRMVLIGTSIYIPIFNISGMIGYLFQAINKTNIYSKSIIIEKLMFIISIITVLFLRYDNYKLIMFLYIMSRMVSLIVLVIHAKEIIFSTLCSFGMIIKSIIDNTRVGLSLMISNIMGLLIIGSTRFMIDKNWGVEVFGKVSFAILLTNLILSFISQISMVLFPILRKIDNNALKSIYRYSSSLLGTIILGCIALYIPASHIIEIWIPQYRDSFFYLSIIIPICLYEGKMNMLSTTYFKVLRKENILLSINISSMILSIIIGLLSINITKDIRIVLLGMVITVGIRSVVSELIICKIMDLNNNLRLIKESVLILIYFISIFILGAKKGVCIYILVYIFYLYNEKNEIISMFNYKYKNIRKVSNE